MEEIKQITERVVMFRTHDEVVMARGSVCEAARKWWTASAERVLIADYAFAVIDNVVKGVYEITGCHQESYDGVAQPPFTGIRNVFDFADAPMQIQQKYINKLLPKEYQSWGQYPVRYTF